MANNWSHMLRSVLLITGLVFAFLLTACSVFTVDAFPPFLTYVSGELDLRDQLPSEIRSVRMHATTVPDGARFFSIVVEPDGPGDAVLVLVDEQLTAVTEREAAPLDFGSRLFTRIDGAIQIGTLIYNPLTGQVTNGPGPVGSLQPIVHDAVDYWAIRPESELQITFDRYSEGFVPDGSWATPVDATVPAEQIRGIWMHPRDLTVGGPDEYVVFLLTSVGLRRTVLTETDLSAETGFPIDSSEGTAGQVLSAGSVDTARETPAGILLADDTRLMRYDRSTGILLDDFELGQNERSDVSYVVAFDPQGEFYLVFDAGNRSLLRVEPWW